MATKQFQNAKLNVTHLDLKDDASRSVLQSGENISHSLGKIARWYKDIIWTDSKATTEVFGIIKLSDDYKSESTETVPTSKTLNDVVKLMKQTGGWNTTYDFNSNIEGDENLQNGQFKVTEHDLEGDIDHYVYIKGLGSAAFTESSAYATAGHTHLYAGSDTVGGAATSANKLNTDAGSDVTPIYFSNGVPVACTYSLNKTVPSNALFTDAKVKQTATTTDADYEILFSSTADNTTRTEGARKNSNLTFNPSTGTLTTTKFVGALSGNATSATTANKLSNTTAIGSSIKPVYFSADGIPVAIDHSIEASVPSDAVFTDTTYTISSGDSNGQIKVTPSEGDPYNVSVKGLGSAAYTNSDEYATAGHTHKYAGSSSAGGVANSAAKLSDIPTAGIGSETKPVFFSGTTGRPVACTYSLNTTVPANAIFTDEKVKQSPVTTDGSFEVLFAGSTGNTAKTEGVGKTTSLTFNPSTGALSATSFSGNGSGLTSLNASNISSGTLSVNRLPGSAVTVGTYGPATGGTLLHSGTFDVPDFTVDAKGRVTGAHTRTFTLPAQYVHPTHTAYDKGLYKIIVDALGHITSATAVVKDDITALGIPAQDTVYKHPTYTSKTSGLYKITVDGLGHVSATTSVTKTDIPALDYVSSTTTRNANTVLAGPVSGAAAAPTFRSLVAADLPSHTHTKSQITDFPTSLKNPNSLTVQGNGTTSFTYDGSAAKTLNIKSGTGISVGSDTSGNITITNTSTNTDTKVTQNNSTANSALRVLLSKSANDTNETNVSYKSSKLTFNPSTGTLVATTFSGALSGNADTATALTSSAGSATQPVYFSSGKPVVCTYTLGKSVPSNAVFTDTKVTQTNTTTAADYRVILSANANDTTETTTARKSTNFLANPSTGEFYAKGYRRIDITGNTVDINTYNLSSGSPMRMFFIEKTNDGAANKTNIPVDNVPFLLDVELIRWVSATDYITRQIYTNAANPANSYVRYCTSGTWGSWTKRVYTDTHYKSHLITGASATATANAAATNGNVYLNMLDNTTVRNSHNIVGSGATTVTSDANGKITISSTNTVYTHPTYTARTGKPTANATPAFGGTFTVSQITSDGTGHVTGATDRTITIPNTTMGAATADTAGTIGLVPAPGAGKQISFLRGDGTWVIPTNTDTKVTQTATTTNANYEVLFSGTADNTTRTEGARKNSNLTFNPSTGVLTTDRLYSARVTGTYLAGNKGSAIINSTASAGAYVMLARMHSTNGYFTHGTYEGKYLLQYTAQSTIDAETNKVTKSVTLLNEYGNSSFPGTVTATEFSGSGASLTSLNASNISSGTLSADRLATSGATAGSYGPSANATPGYGATFNVPYITVDNKGRVTAISTKTVKIPASDNTNTTYTFATGDTNGTFKVTPSGGSATNIAIKGLGSAAYTASSAYATASHTHNYAGSSSAGGPAYSVEGGEGTTEIFRHVWFSTDSVETKRAYSDKFMFEPSLGILKFNSWYPLDITDQTVDLNSYTDGRGKYGYRRYICKTTGGGNNISNKPCASPFLLEVFLIRFVEASKDYITKQVYHAFDKTTYQRFCTGGTWDSWTEMKYTDTNTKNTAGSTNTSSKIFLIGATSQAANPRTYSHDTAYVGTDGCLYSNSTKVSVEGHAHGLGHSNFTVFIDATTNTWAAIGVDGNKYVLKSIRTNDIAPPYLLDRYASGIVFGGSDTRGVLSISYSSPQIRFAGGANTTTEGGTAKWYITLTGTHNTSYSLDTINHVKQSVTASTGFRGVILGTNNTTNATDTRETTVTGQGYITDKIFAQPSTGSLYATNMNAWVSGNDDVQVGLIRSGNSSWRFLNSEGILSLQNNFYSDKVQSWYNVAQFNYNGANSIKLMTPPQVTGTNRSISYGYRSIDMAICSKNSWSMSIKWLNNARDTVRGSFGAYGAADALSYYYWGTAYDSTRLRLYQNNNGGLVSQHANGFRIAHSGYGVIFRNDGSDFYILLTDKKTDGSELTGNNWNDKRPLVVHLNSGKCDIDGDITGHSYSTTFLKNAIFYYEGSDIANKRYYRVAYAKTTNTYTDMNGVFLITDEFGEAFGIIKVRARTEATAGVFGNTKNIKWIINSGFDKSIVKLVVKNNYDVDTAKTGTATAEIWLDNNTQWKGIKFTILSQGWRKGSAAIWTMSSKETGGSSEIASTGITSTINATNQGISNNAATSTIAKTVYDIDANTLDETIGIGYTGDGITASEALQVACFTSKVATQSGARWHIKDLSFDNLKTKLGLDYDTIFSGTAAASVGTGAITNYTRLVIFCKNISNTTYFTVQIQATTGYHYHVMSKSPPPGAAQTSNSFYGLLFNVEASHISVSAGKYSNLSSSASLATGPTVHITKVIGYKF